MVSPEGNPECSPEFIVSFWEGLIESKRQEGIEAPVLETLLLMIRSHQYRNEGEWPSKIRMSYAPFSVSEDELFRLLGGTMHAPLRTVTWTEPATMFDIPFEPAFEKRWVIEVVGNDG